MDNKIEKINIPLKWVFALLSASGSGLIIAVTIGIWVSRVDVQAANTQKEVTQLQSERQLLTQELREIRYSLGRIEGILEKRK